MDSKFIWIRSGMFLPGHKLQKHTHTFFHYIYVISGTGQISIGGKLYTFQPGYIYTTPVGTEHAFSIDKENTLSILEIKFSLNDLPLTEKLNRLPHELPVAQYPVRPLLEDLLQETREKSVLHRELEELKLKTLLYYLLRCAKEQSPGILQKQVRQNRKNPKDMGRVLQYIQENLDKEIRLEDLSQIACLEKTYFLKKFKRLLGCTPMAYIHKLRIERARELLLFSDMNVTQIAEMTGFKSVHHFSNAFYAQTGIRPTLLKKIN